jgi:high-affinity K+ transport system ATPase subunit B
MNVNDPLQQNIRHATGQNALKKIRAIVDEENRNNAVTAAALRWLLRYGWIVLLVIAAILAKLIGVY